MEILTKEGLRLRHKEILKKIKEGSIFIHPTDTIYGIGCNALDSNAIETIRRLKERPKSPLSIWVPSIEWIEKNCILTPNAKKWLAKLPGPYTLIIPLKKENNFCEVLLQGSTSIGIRMPDHWFSKIVKELDIPIITTSANKKGEPFMTSLENIDPDLQKEVEFMISDGLKEGRPSKLVHVDKEEVVER